MAKSNWRRKGLVFSYNLRAGTQMGTNVEARNFPEAMEEIYLLAYSPGLFILLSHSIPAFS